MIARHSDSSVNCSFPRVYIFMVYVACVVAFAGCEDDPTDCQVAADLSLECDGDLPWANCDEVDEELLAYVAEAEGCDEYLAREDEAIDALNCQNVTRWRDECDPEGACPITCDSIQFDQQRLAWVENCDDFWFVCDSTDQN